MGSAPPPPPPRGNLHDGGENAPPPPPHPFSFLRREIFNSDITDNHLRSSPPPPPRSHNNRILPLPSFETLLANFPGEGEIVLWRVAATRRISAPTGDMYSEFIRDYGASKEVAASLLKWKKSMAREKAAEAAAANHEVCAVCLDGLQQRRDRRVVALGCCHVFHGDCIDKWLHLHNKKACPICRADTTLNP